MAGSFVDLDDQQLTQPYSQLLSGIRGTVVVVDVNLRALPLVMFFLFLAPPLDDLVSHEQRQSQKEQDDSQPVLHHLSECVASNQEGCNPQHIAEQSLLGFRREEQNSGNDCRNQPCRHISP